MEVSRFAELVYSIVEALDSGGLDPNNEDVKSVIGSGLGEIIEIIKNNRHAADPKIEERMKVILRSAKNDERDYVFSKMLKVPDGPKIVFDIFIRILAKSVTVK